MEVKIGGDAVKIGDDADKSGKKNHLLVIMGVR